MDIMHAYDIILSNGQENKKKKPQAKTCISEYLEPYFSTKSPPYLPI
jgi:hypothetical protein